MLGLQLGFAYDAGALVADGERPPSRPGSVREYVPSALPGARVPHAWVTRAGERISTLDLFAYDRFTLVTGPAGRSWVGAVSSAVPIDYVTVGDDVHDERGQWMDLLGIDADGAVLVRPDQHVAWRSRGGVTDAAATLTRVLALTLAVTSRTAEGMR